MIPQKRMKLGEMRKGSKAIIASVGASENADLELVGRLLEMGLLEGSLVEVIHEAPFGGDPFAIRVRGVLIALQRQLANMIEVFDYESGYQSK